MRGLEERLPSFDELEPEGLIASDDAEGYNEADEDVMALEAWHEDGEADESPRTPVPAPLSGQGAKGREPRALHLPGIAVKSVPGSYWGAALQEDVRLMRALAKAAGRSEERGYALALIAASVPLALRRYPECYGGLVALLPALLHAAGVVTERWHADPHSRARLARFPWLLGEVLERLIGQLRQGRPVSAGLVRQVFYQTARRAEGR